MNKNMGYFHLTEFDCPQIRLYEDGTFYDEIKQTIISIPKNDGRIYPQNLYGVLKKVHTGTFHNFMILKELLLFLISEDWKNKIKCLYQILGPIDSDIDSAYIIELLETPVRLLYYNVR